MSCGEWPFTPLSHSACNTTESCMLILLLSNLRRKNDIEACLFTSDLLEICLSPALAAVQRTQQLIERCLRGTQTWQSVKHYRKAGRLAHPLTADSPDRRLHEKQSALKCSSERPVKRWLIPPLVATLTAALIGVSGGLGGSLSTCRGQLR